MIGADELTLCDKHGVVIFNFGGGNQSVKAKQNYEVRMRDLGLTTDMAARDVREAMWKDYMANNYSRFPLRTA